MFSMFNKPASTTPAATGTQPQGTQQTPAKQEPNPSGVTAGGSADGGANNSDGQNATKPVNPLDAFTGMFNTSTSDGEKAPSFTLPQDKLSAVAKGLDFNSTVPPELMQKALGGDPKALMDVINHVGQQSYQNSMAHMSALSNEYVNSRLGYEDKTFGSKVKQELTNSELSANTTNFNHPVVKQQLTETARALSRQHPDASPQQIAQMARDYVTTLAQAINPQSTTGDGSNGTKAAETNWDEFFSKG